MLTMSFLMMSILTLSSSPLKMSLSLAAISTMISMVSYQISSSIFISCAVIISFSSGMMILFSYCSMLSNYESKNKLKVNFVTMSLLLLLTEIFSSPIFTENLIQKMIIEISQTQVLIFLMSVVMISMVCMNMSFFNPTKKFMQSY